MHNKLYQIKSITTQTPKQSRILMEGGEWSQGVGQILVAMAALTKFFHLCEGRSMNWRQKISRRMQNVSHWTNPTALFYIKYVHVSISAFLMKSWLGDGLVIMWLGLYSCKYLSFIRCVVRVSNSLQSFTMRREWIFLNIEPFSNDCWDS